VTAESGRDLWLSKTGLTIHRGWCFRKGGALPWAWADGVGLADVHARVDTFGYRCCAFCLRKGLDG